MRGAKIFGIALAVAVTAVLSRAAWVHYEYPVREWTDRALTASTTARWWRCRGAARPLLLSASTPWHFGYSWEGGFGPGVVALHIDQSGRATLNTRANGADEDVVTDHIIAGNDITGLAAVIDDSGLLCQTPQLREGYLVHDLGRYTIEVTAGTNQKTVFVDGCHTLPDSYAFGEVAEYIQSLRAQLRDEVSWGPFATASTPGQCRE